MAFPRSTAVVGHPLFSCDQYTDSGGIDGLVNRACQRNRTRVLWLMMHEARDARPNPLGHADRKAVWNNKSLVSQQPSADHAISDCYYSFKNADAWLASQILKKKCWGVCLFTSLLRLIGIAVHLCNRNIAFQRRRTRDPAELQHAGT